jgi:sortase A
MDWQRKTGAAIATAGALLLAVYAVPTVYGKAMAHIAVAEFRAQSSSNSLWDSARIRAYQDSLKVGMEPTEAILRIPKVNLEVPVFEGTSDLVMNRGVGHVPGTAMPGKTGNLAIAGHRDGFFRGLKDVRQGDVIEVQHPVTGGERTDHYVVKTLKIIAPTDTSVLKSTDKQTLTLITCYPFYYVGAAPERYIVQASLLPAKGGS